MSQVNYHRWGMTMLGKVESQNLWLAIIWHLPGDFGDYLAKNKETKDTIKRNRL